MKLLHLGSKQVLGRLSRGLADALVVSTLIILATGLIAPVWAYDYNTMTQITPDSTSVFPGGVVELSASVQSGCAPFEVCPVFSGTLSWDDGDSGGSFDIPSCTFAPSNTSVDTCTTLYHAPKQPGLAVVIATFSGDTAHSPSSGQTTIKINSSSATYASTIETTTNVNLGGQGSLGLSTTMLALVGAAAAVAVLAAAVVLTRRKPL